MEIINYMINNMDFILQKTWEHIFIVSVAIIPAIFTGVAIGIAITADENYAKKVITTASVILTIPSLAIFGILIPVLSPLGYGIGKVPAIIALYFYAQLPILRNTYTAIKNVDPALREAAKGMGMTLVQRLVIAEIPLAIPVILAGVRTAVIVNISIATIASYIGAGGLGDLIARGISQTDKRQLVAGIICVSVLAICMDTFLSYLQRRLTPKGIREEGK